MAERASPSASPDDLQPTTSAPDEHVNSRRTWPWALGIAVTGALIAWMRLPGVVAGQLYAEDGRIFIGGWLSPRDWSVWIEPYAGYQHFVPRTVAWLITTFLPVSWWAVGVNVAACLIVGAASGLVFAFSRDVVSFVPARLALGLFTVLTPVVGIEALGNLANVHWFLLYLSLWVVLAVPRSTMGAVGMALLALACTATEPQCLIFLPLVMFRVIQVRRMWPVVVGWTIGAVAQVATTLIAPRAVATDYPPAVSTIEGYVLNVGMTLGSDHQNILGWALSTVGWWVGFLGVALVISFAVLGMVRAGLQAKVAIGALLYGSAVSWTASYVLGSNPYYFYSEMSTVQLANPPLVRWATAASLMLVATIAVTIGVLADRSERWRLPGAGLVVMLLVIMATNALTTDSPEASGWKSAVEQAEATCPAAPDSLITVETTPFDHGWVVRVPCSILTS